MEDGRSRRETQKTLLGGSAEAGGIFGVCLGKNFPGLLMMRVAEKVSASQTLESKSMTEASEVILLEALLLECEQCIGRHPLRRSIRRTANHRQTIGLDLDLWLGGLWLHRRFRRGKSAS